MTNQNSSVALWTRILEALEEKLQYGLLEQAKAVVDVKFEGHELTLTVSSDEAAEFFSAEVNQQRLIIMSRPIISIEKIRVKQVKAAPLLG